MACVKIRVQSDDYFTNYSYQSEATSPLADKVECSTMAQETRVQSQVESYQRLKKWY